MRGSTRVLYICYEFPVLTQTFTIAEVKGLLELGIDLEVVACRCPRAVEGVPARCLEPCLPGPALVTLLRWLVRRPARSLSLLFAVATARYRDESFRCWARGFLQLLWGARLAEDVRKEGRPAHFHAQFVDAASTVAFVAGRLLDAPFSMTNHTAYNPYLLGPKLEHAKVVLSISEFDRRLISRMARCGHPSNVKVVYQGIDVDGWRFRDPGAPGSPIRVLSVAALREKKGHHLLIEGMARLRDGGIDAVLTLVGEGPERHRLERRIAALGLGDRAELVGAEPPSRVRERMREADVFALACIRARNGDLDGIPISLMEAMATGVPVVSTRLSGIPELVEDGTEGLLAEPGDPEGLAACIRRLVEEPGLSSRLAGAALAKVRRQHDLRGSLARVAEELRG